MLLQGKNIAFVFSDPAGANVCKSFAQVHASNHDIKVTLFSNRNYFHENMPNFHLTDIVPDFVNLKFDCVFTGTSHPESSKSFEVNCIREAKKAGSYVISFIDHWVNFKLRFTGLENSELPDEIWVLDETAKKLAIKEGLPEERLVIHSNPYLDFLKTYWRPSFDHKKYLKEIQIPESGYHILFAPDPLSMRNGKEISGFTEVEALDDLLLVLSDIGVPVHLIVKSHPLQPKGILEAGLKKYKNIDSYLLGDANSLELINASDLVIGFYSNLLLEAESLGTKVLRYYPGYEDSDLLKHKTSLKKVQNKQELKTELKQCIYG